MIIICIASSWYHSLGALSFILNYLERGGEVGKLIVLKGEFLGKGADIIEFDKVLENKCEVVFVKNVTEIKNNFSSHKKNECILLSPNPHPYRALKILKSMACPPCLVELEEGLGSYGGWLQYFNAVKREAKNIKFVIKNLTTYVPKAIYVSRSVRHTKRWNNFDSDLKINEDVCLFYKRAIKLVSQKNSDSDFIRNKKVLFSSPFVELKMIDEKEYMTLLDDVFHDKDEVLVKVHPSEDERKYLERGYQVYRGDKKGEQFLASLAEGCVVYCASSTVAYTARIFFGLQIVRLKNIDFFYEKLSDKQKSIIDMCAEHSI